MLTPDAIVKQAPLIEVHYYDLHKKALEVITREVGLSSREAEVLDLFSRGRSTTYISNHLFISQNTVETHLKHVYEKTGIRSKQGLIDLVESKEKKLVENEAAMSANSQ